MRPRLIETACHPRHEEENAPVAAMPQGFDKQRCL
jgi:hypothetical protein